MSLVVSSWEVPVQGHSYPLYRGLLFARSLLILVGVGVFDWLSARRPQTLTWAFRSIKNESDKLRIFGIVTTGGGSNETLPGITAHILSAYAWVVRISIFVLSCYFWDFVEPSSPLLRLSNPNSRNLITTFCAQGWDCFVYNDRTKNEASAFKRAWLTNYSWDMEQICKDWIQSSGSSYPPIGTPSDSRNTVACFTITDNYPLNVSLMPLGVAIGVFYFITGVFEGTTWLLLRFRRQRIFNARLVVDLLIVVTAILSVATIVLEAVESTTVSALRITTLAVPLLLFQARRASRKLLLVRAHRTTARLRKLRSTDLMPVDFADDRPFGSPIDKDSDKERDKEWSTKSTLRHRKQQIQNLLTKSSKETKQDY